MKVHLTNQVRDAYPTLEAFLQRNFELSNTIDSETVSIQDSASFQNETNALDTIVITNRTDLENVIFLNTNPINHLIGNSSCLEKELERVLRKIQTNNLFGIEKYLNEDAIIHSLQILHSKDAPEQIESLLSKFNYDEVFSSPRDNLRVVLNELIMNAFFHQEHLIDQNRKNSVFVSSDEAINVLIGMDSVNIVILVKDNIGKIDRDRVLSSIKRGFIERRPRTEGPGAGLGLMMVYENINQLHINNKKNRFCEFVGIIDISKRYKNFKERITSFHYFEEE
ncbi:ATP-binding protein [Bacteriovorax sp. Seq25_V]|uniref:ATP-binding protein n=1 Tax=Bacteriovorax sp. Seq25_V TaxID=1201288 RepID=UPI00038A4A02|nr:ATP-binding protein [Bacteriovorax sp. Seq25_V]EQC45258.1 GHKL domain protein [Bacteriovorax sp. Seq25_V]